MSYIKLGLSETFYVKKQYAREQAHGLTEARSQCYEEVSGFLYDLKGNPRKKADKGTIA